MNAQLTGQIVGLAILGLALFIVVTAVVTSSIKQVIHEYFEHKLAFMKALIEMQPPDELIEMVEAIQKRNNDRMVGGIVPPPRVDRNLISKGL